MVAMDESGLPRRFARLPSHRSLPVPAKEIVAGRNEDVPDADLAHAAHRTTLRAMTQTV